MFSAQPKLVLEAAPDAMVIIDAAGMICFANRQVSALFGYPHDEMIGRNVEMLMPERFRQRHVAYRDEYPRHPNHMRVRLMGEGLDLYGLRRDGAEFPLEISISPIEDGGRSFIAAAIHDTTDRKRIQSELLAARAASDQAREMVVRASQAKSRFLATASHGLRQPLQTLAMLNGALRRKVSEPDAVEALAQQEEAIGAMARLLNACLDISKLESGAIKPEPADFALATLFEEMRQEFNEIAAGKGLKFEIEQSPACVHSDASLVEALLRNLVSNAIKYTCRGRVALRCVLAPDSMVRLEVLDTGIGIPADELSSIYDEFYKGGVCPNSSLGGYGLGLSIVQRITKLLTLTLEVRSRVGEGSSFSFLLPSAIGKIPVLHLPSSASAAVRMSPDKRETPRVLLVSDDPAVRDATRMLLKVEGYRVTAVASLREALEVAPDGVDLLVTDYHLCDGATGTQVIAAVREALGVPLKSLLITGDTSTAIRELARDPNLRIASDPLRVEEMLTLLRGLMAGDMRQLL
jgi:PAS domain S-box-containing protein